MAQTNISNSRRNIVITVAIIALLLLAVFVWHALNSKRAATQSADDARKVESVLPLENYYTGQLDEALSYIASQPKSHQREVQTQHLKAQILTLIGGVQNRKDSRAIFKRLHSKSKSSAIIWQEVIESFDKPEAERAALARNAYAQCSQAYAAKTYFLSLRLCEASLALDPQDKSTRQIYGQSLYSTEITEYENLAQRIFEDLNIEGVEAATNWLSAISARKASRAKTEGYGAALEDYMAKDYGTAKQRLETLLQDSPDSQQLNQLYAQTLVSLGDEVSLRKSLVILKTLKAQDVASAQAWLDVAERRLENGQTQDLYQSALADYREKDYAPALASLAKIFDVSPDNAQASILRAQIYALSSDPAQLDAATQYYRGGSQILDDKQKRWMAIVLRNKFEILSWPQILASMGSGASTYELEDISKALLTQDGSVSEMAQGLRVFVRADQRAGRNANESFKRLSDLGAGVNCRQFKSALRSETRVLKAAGLTEPEMPKCKTGISGEDNRALFTRLFDSVDTLRGADLHMAMFDPDSQNATLMARQFEIVPPGFTKPFSIVSDADSQRFDDTAAHMDLLQDRLGLPISTSVFIIDPVLDTKTAKQTNIEAYPTSLFFSQVKGSGVFGSDASAANLAQDWHRGLYDHFHGWGSTRLNATHILENPRGLADMDSINLTSILSDVTLNDGVPKPYGKSGLFLESWIDNRLAVLRLFFTQQPSRETTIRVNLQDRAIAYDVNAKGAYVSKVTEDGRELWMAELPIGAGTDVSYAREASPMSANDNTVTVSVIAPDCAAGTALGKSCDMQLVKIDADVMGREAAEVTTQWLNTLLLHSDVYTAHGGDRLSSYGPQSFISEQWKTPQPAGKTYVGYDQPLAGAETGKAFIGDLVEDLGVRGVRAFRSDLGNRSVMSAFPSKPLTEKEFGNTVSFMTNWAVSPKLLDGETFGRDLNLQEDTIEALKKYDTCSFSAVSFIPGYIEASLRSKASDYMGGEIWYTHFATKCASNGVKNRSLGFDDTTALSLERLSRRSHGLMSEAEIETYPNRLWVLPPSGGFRSRILESEVNRYGLDIVTSGTVTNIESRESEFFNGEMFPREGLATRDLNGLTVPVNAGDLKSASIQINGQDIGPVVKIVKNANAYMTILDTTDPLNISDSLNNNNELSTASKTCRAAVKPLTLRNISSLGFTTNSKSNLAIEIILKDKPGSLVFTNAVGVFKSKFESRKNTVMGFHPDAATRVAEGNRYLVPTYDIAQLNGWKSSDMPTILSGQVEKLCIYSETGSARFSDIRAYRYVTSNVLPGDPLLIGGRVTPARGALLEGYAARITPQGGRPYFASVNADGFYYSRIDVKPPERGIDQALKDARVKIDLMRADPKSGAFTRVGGVDVHVLGSRLDIDLKAGN